MNDIKSNLGKAIIIIRNNTKSLYVDRKIKMLSDMKLMKDAGLWDLVPDDEKHYVETVNILNSKISSVNIKFLMIFSSI